MKVLCILSLLISLIFCQEDSVEQIVDVFTETDEQSITKNEESYVFQTEVTRLMDIIINSLYSNREVFLRELISNAADALEKYRFQQLQKSEGLDTNLAIKIQVDPKSNTIVIQDNGIGLTKAELITNLGTIAKSGTSTFLKNLKETGDLSLIGQFGVGFYSAFLVANQVTVTSKSDEDPDQHIWKSSVDGSFVIVKDPRGNTLKRGTRITLHLKDDAAEFLNEKVVHDHVKRYNQYVNYPIYILTNEEVVDESSLDVPDDETKNESADEKDDEKDDKKDDEKDDEVKEDSEKDKADSEEADEKNKETKEKKYVQTWKQINLHKPIWTRSKSEVTDAEYIDFYKSLGHTDEPLAYIHFNAEGDVEFKALLYVPSVARSDKWNSYFQGQQDTIKIYSKRVLMTDSTYKILPAWANFVEGIVDSNDLPLKVDRENYTQGRILRSISKKLVSKILEMFKANDKTTDDSKKHEKLMKNYSTQLWLGCADDDANRAKITSLLRVQTSKTGPDTFITLQEYTDRNPDKPIYYLTTEDYNTGINSPHLKFLKQKDVEVVFVFNQLGEACFEKQYNFNSRKFKSVEKLTASDELDVGVSKEERKKYRKAFSPLIKAWKTALSNNVGEVQLAFNLVEDPAVIAARQYGPSAYTDRIARSHIFAENEAFLSHNISRRLLLNPHHPLIQKYLNMASENPDDPAVKDGAEMIHDIALINGGYFVQDYARIANKMFSLYQEKQGLDPKETHKAFNIDDFEESSETTETSEQDDEEIDFSGINMQDILKNRQAKPEDNNNDDTTAPAEDEL